MREKITFYEALEILENTNFQTLKTERVFLQEAHNRVLAKDIYAPCDMPLVPLSSMDGYAINSKFQENVEFEILKDNRAGNEEIPTLSLETPKAIKTFTGAAIPKNADILVPIENVLIENGKLKIVKMSQKGDYIREVGANYKKGEKLLKAGTKLSGNYIGLLASLNQVFIEVYEKPKVGVLVSGDEILELGEHSDSINKIYNANGYLLSAKIQEYGAIPKLYPILKDDKNLIEKSLEDALKTCDLVISTGGASVGDYDFIAQIAKERQDEVVFKGVGIKPGQHVLYARFFGKHFFGLPGFPNSTLVTFELFVSVILAKMCGNIAQKTKIKVPLGTQIYKKDKRIEFRVCNVIENDGKFRINFEGKKDFLSAILNNFCPLENVQIGLAILDKEYFKEEDEVLVILL
ncbi:molybdopterin molybdenumtransferase MoeA [Helicobacter valdiviensis]|uniref:Molybdopterin molybdenumtransferase n=1 Tax=Helicobacter valdiviensis TaxID=1458358 RepID=A0A2W6MUX1_9HELI|nr:molybdopterin molybdotransferase MoeA [Helicobacter valdiviensis]PZT48152.1 molybdopterin molybdenumtransferase MoeA [Helicobacter valdiviensis]